MISNKQDLKEYLKYDKVALGIPANRVFPRPIVDDIWKFEILLRKTEYHMNKGGFFNRFLLLFIKTRFLIISKKLGFTIPPNVFGPGLSIAHYGCIVVSSGARIGANCRIHECVTIGATDGSAVAATIGNNCFLGSGAKVIGTITIGNDIAVGAGAVVVSDIIEDHVTVAGVPAKIISHNGSEKNIIKAFEC